VGLGGRFREADRRTSGREISSGLISRRLRNRVEQPLFVEWLPEQWPVRLPDRGQHICPLVAGGGSVEVRSVMSSPMMHGA
jgi:hypothetical protein